MYKIVTPTSTTDFNSYYQVRWELLRKPWDQISGSEKDELEGRAIHRMAVTNDKVIAVGRLHFIDDTTAQIRYMAVSKEFKKQGWYKAGDSARIDEDGYVWVIGRIDDVIKVSGYRLGTAEVESALVCHPDVSEAAAIGLPHELKGNAIHAYVILRAGVEGSTGLDEELRNHVGHEMGPIAKPETIAFVEALPKTRSGKIMRRLLKARALGLPEGDISTLED